MAAAKDSTKHVSTKVTCTVGPESSASDVSLAGKPQLRRLVVGQHMGMKAGSKAALWIPTTATMSNVPVTNLDGQP